MGGTNGLSQALLLVGLALRIYLLSGPFGEIDADEAVVGLMALEMPREIPAFYWEQQYLGTIEPLVAAAFFVPVAMRRTLPTPRRHVPVAESVRSLRHEPRSSLG